MATDSEIAPRIKVDRNFDKYDMPYDVLWLDIEHTDGKRYFTWDNRHFKEPAKMIEDLSSRGRKMVTIVDPHIKVDNNYHVYKGPANRYSANAPSVGQRD